MKKLSAILILFMVFVSLGFVMAEGESGSQPCQFYGTITINSDNTNLNYSTISAYVIGENETEADFFNPSTKIPTGNYAIKINDVGSEIIFKIKGHNVNQETQTCVSGKSTELNLTATITNFEGNETDIKTNLENSSFLVGDSEDLEQGFFGTQEVVIKENNETKVKFNWDFDSGILNLSSINVTKQDTNATKGSIQINGIELQGNETKTVYLDKIANTTEYVCVLDEENVSVSEMTEDCSGTNEVPVLCDGTNHDGYICNDLGSTFEISGLTHSTISESDYTEPVTTTSTSSGGGGGGGSSSSSTTTTCTENWTCGEWGECDSDGVQSRICTDSNACGTILTRPDTIKSCVEQLNAPAEENEDETNEEEISSSITGAVIGNLGTRGSIFAALIIVIIIASAFYLIRRNKK